jgi:adenosylcobinamide kinase / adenosylcobinamide-phosphate guanylyltransferase
MLTLLVGGVRSGKSALAVELARRSGLAVLFIATAEARDAEMTARIARHREDRPREWQTVEEPVGLGAVLGGLPAETCAVVDCLTLWTANLLERGFGPEEISAEAAAAARIAAARAGPTIVVSNEVGLGVVPPTPLGRAYRDVLGTVNRVVGDAADRVLLVLAGRVVELERWDRTLGV